MKLLHLALALPALTWAAVSEDLLPRKAQDLPEGCIHPCPSQQPEKCECDVRNAIRCAGLPEDYPIPKICGTSGPDPFVVNPPTPDPFVVNPPTLPSPSPPPPPPPPPSPPPSPPPPSPPPPLSTSPPPARTDGGGALPDPTRTHPIRTTVSPKPTRTSLPSSTPSSVYTRCGPENEWTCPSGQTCLDDPNIFDCLECPGYCVALNDSVCGETDSWTCPGANEYCIDDPRDDCDEYNCPGTCVFLDVTWE